MIWCFSTAQEQGTLPIGKDTKSIVVECHISVHLFKSFQGLAEGATTSAIESSLNMLQFSHPPSFVFNLHQRGLTTTKQVVTGTLTITFGWGCVGLVIHEKSGAPTIVTFPPPGKANHPFTPSFSNTISTGSCNATVAWVRSHSSFSTNLVIVEAWI